MKMGDDKHLRGERERKKNGGKRKRNNLM